MAETAAAAVSQPLRGSVRLTLEVEGYERADVALSRFGRDIRDWRPFFQDVLAPKFFADVEANFEEDGRRVGGWPPLSARYAAWKAKHYPGAGLLRRTYALVESLAYLGGGRMGPQGVFRMTETEAELGTSAPYAKYHQSPRPRRIIPLRRFLFLPYNASETYGRLLHTWVVEQAANAGLTASGHQRAVYFGA